MMPRLRDLREKQGLTQDQLADMTGMSKGFLSQLETGARNPSMESLSRLSKALHVPEADLLEPRGFAEPGEAMARRVLSNLDKPSAAEPDFKLGTDGQKVQIIATVDREGLDRLIRQLELMKQFLTL